MLRRRSAPDHDAVVAARRRLAALGEAADRDELVGCCVEDEPGHAPPSVDEAFDDESARHRRPGFAVSVGRFAITPSQVALVAVCLLGLMALTCWWVIRSVPDTREVPVVQERHVPQRAPVAPSPSTVPVSPSSGVVVVDVGGKVRDPGVVELPTGSRVIDAVEAAGGVRHGVSTRSVNLARPLVDGEQVLVGVKRAPLPATPPETASDGGATSAGDTSATGDTAGDLIDINTADQTELEELPGVGPVTAEAIMSWREENGGFSSVDELMEVDGIGEATLAELEPLVTV